MAPPHTDYHTERFNKNSKHSDPIIRLMAYYKFGKYLDTRSKRQRTQLRLEVTPFAVKASLRAYNFYQQCGRHRLGLNPEITPTMFGKKSLQFLNDLASTEFFAGAQTEGGNDLLQFLET